MFLTVYALFCRQNRFLWLILSIILTSFLWAGSYFFFFLQCKILTLSFTILFMSATFHILNLSPLFFGSGLVGMTELKSTVTFINQSHEDGESTNKWVGGGLERQLDSLWTPSFSERWRIHYLCLRLTSRQQSVAGGRIDCSWSTGLQMWGRTPGAHLQPRCTYLESQLDIIRHLFLVLPAQFWIWAGQGVSGSMILAQEWVGLLSMVVGRQNVFGAKAVRVTRTRVCGWIPRENSLFSSRGREGGFFFKWLPF